MSSSTSLIAYADVLRNQLRPELADIASFANLGVLYMLLDAAELVPTVQIPAKKPLGGAENIFLSHDFTHKNAQKRNAAPNL